MSYQKKKGGYLLRIGSRQSSKHLRIYQKRNGLEFELEIKKQETKKLQSFLFSNQLETFEDSSIRCYYEYLWNYLVFENPFTEWLVVGGRKLRMNRFLSDSLALSYLKPNLARDIYQSFDKKPETLCFIQLLSFLDQRKDKIQILERSLGFVKIHFQAEDFFNQTFDQIKENVYIFNKEKEVNFLCQKKKPSSEIDKPENKAGYDDQLIDLRGQNHRYELEGSSVKHELDVILRDPKASKSLKLKKWP